MTEEEFHAQMAKARERGRADRQPEIDALRKMMMKYFNLSVFLTKERKKYKEKNK